MPFKPITREQYDEMVESHRVDPGNITRAAKAAKVTRNTARKAFVRGWPARNMSPIKEIVEEERVFARARMAMREDVVDKEELLKEQAGREEVAKITARKDAVSSRYEEAQLVRLHRANTIRGHAAMIPAFNIMMNMLKELEEKSNSKELTVTQNTAGNYAAKVGSFFRALTEASRSVIECERRLLGEPTDVIGVDIRNLSDSDIHAQLEQVSRVIARVKSDEDFMKAAPEDEDFDTLYDHPGSDLIH